MEFILHYRGILPSKGTPKIKQTIRRVFHNQLKILWDQKPLSIVKHSYLVPETRSDHADQTLLRPLGDFIFAPLVCEKEEWTATLDILLLKPEPPGRIITQSGDIDNRLKTLLDSLRMPHNYRELPSNDSPKDNERPFLCLLEDDNLLTGLSITTDRLLENLTNESEVELIIKVKTTAHRPRHANVRL